MVAPLIIIIVILAVGGVSAAIALSWDNIVTNIRGKDVVILGAKRVGKTTLHKFLRSGEVAEKYVYTKKEKVPANRYKLEELELVLKDGVDISGSDDFLSEWKELFERCDYCFYLFNVFRTYKSEQKYIDLITKHLTYILRWSSLGKKTPIFYVIGTFADKVPRFLSMSDKARQKFEEDVRKIIKPALINAKVKASSVIIGSLKNNKQRELLVHELLSRIAQE